MILPANVPASARKIRFQYKLHRVRLKDAVGPIAPHRPIDLQSEIDILPGRIGFRTVVVEKNLFRRVGFLGKFRVHQSFNRRPRHRHIDLCGGDIWIGREDHYVVKDRNGSKHNNLP